MTEVELSTLFAYQPDGRLIKHSTMRLGDSDTNAAGYRRVTFDRGALGRFRALAHRIVWVLHHGAIPDGQLVDHIDGDFLNNRINNLRLVTKSGNSQNAVYKGYGWAAREGKYVATIKLNGKSKFLGYYDNPEAARAAYLAAKAVRHEYATPRTLI